MHAEKMEEWNRKVRTLYTWSHLYLGFKVAQVHSRLLPEQKRAAFWKTRHSKFAQAMWSNIADLRGWWVKVGQFLSTRGDLLPDEYVSELSKVQDMMPTSPFPVIKTIIEDEMGLAVNDVFEWIEEKALASASIGQVHKAKLKPGARALLKRCRPNPRNGTGHESETAEQTETEGQSLLPLNSQISDTESHPHVEEGEVELADESGDDWGNDMVVLKIQHPNVDRMLLQDMELLKQLSWAFGLLEKGMMFNDVLEEWGKESRMELDFRYEAFNQKYIQRCMREHRSKVEQSSASTETPGTDVRVYDHVASAEIMDDVKIPSVIYATKRLLIMEYVNGFKCTDMSMIEKYKVDVNELCTKVVKSFADQIHVYGVFNADPHPGNIIIQLDPKTYKPIPVLLDWGLVKRFTQKQRIAFCKLIIAISQIDLMGLMSAFQDMGFKFKPKVDKSKRGKKKELADARAKAKANARESDKDEDGDTVEIEDLLEIEGNDESQDVIPVDPEIYMDAITVLFKNSAANSEENGPFISQKDKDAAWAKAKETKVSDVQAVNPLDDWPKDIIFFLRVASLLHGLTVQLKAQVPFFQIMLEKAEEAVREDMGIIPRELQFIYKAHGSATAAAYYKCPYQELVFGQNVSKLLAMQSTDHTNTFAESRSSSLIPLTMPSLRTQSPDSFRVRSLLEYKLFKILSTLCGDGLLVGVQVCVWHRKFQRVDICLGRMGVYDSRPVNQRTLFTAFSLTNVLMVTMILYLVSKGKLRMSDCVSEWWDGFIRGDKRLITIYDMLSHQTGLHSWLPSTLSLNQLCKYEYMIKVAENATPVCPPSQCGHYPHICISYLYHHLLQSVLKQSPGKYLRQTCLKDWKLKHLSKLVYFPVEKPSKRNSLCPPTTTFESVFRTADSMMSPDPNVLVTPELEQTPPLDDSQHNPLLNALESALMDSEEPSVDSQPSPDTQPLMCHFSLDEAAVINDIQTSRKLHPNVISALMAMKEDEAQLPPTSKSLSASSELLKTFRQSDTIDKMFNTSPSNILQRSGSITNLNVSLSNIPVSGNGPAHSSSITPYKDIYSRLATVSRDLGVAKMADAANMNKQTIGATDEELLLDPAERSRQQLRKEWLQRLQDLQNQSPAPQIPDKALKGTSPKRTFLSKFPGRVSVMEEYIKQQEAATSKLVALQALLDQKSEGLTAFQLMRRRPHLLDPMFFNAEPIIPLLIPFANARVSARAMATILHYISRGAILKDKVVSNALKPKTLDLSLEARVATGGWVPLYGLGYQLLPLRELSPCMSAKENLVNSNNFELRPGRIPLQMPEKCWGARYLFRSELAARPQQPCWTSANVTVDLKLAKAGPTRASAVSRKASATKDDQASERRSSSSSSAFTEGEALTQGGEGPTAYAFGGSDTGGNLCFSLPSEQLTCCVLVNDHVTGAQISRIVLEEVLGSFGFEVVNNLSSLPTAGAPFL